jgi:lytic murein transglycosylase
MRKFFTLVFLIIALQARAQEDPSMAPDAIFMAQAHFHECIASLWPQAQARGISYATFNGHLGKIEPDMSVIGLMSKQPEFERPIWSYIDDLVDRERILKGRQMLAKYKAIWPRLEQMFGVDRYTLIALWGVESNFGKSIGDRSVIRSTATLSCIGRRQDYFRNELFSALEIVQNGDVPPSHLRGSWAGAFGHTQFMPSEFKPDAVDFDGNGHKNIVDSVPDSLASSANNLKKKGWQAKRTWGYEVKLKPKFDLRLTGKSSSLSAWVKAGAIRANGKAFPYPEDSATLEMPAGVKGPAFLLLKNFDLLHSYNGSEAYAYAVGHLADRIHGGGAFIGKWPRYIRMLNSQERQEMQRYLTDLGFDTGGTEGRIGAKTRAALRDYQTKFGLPADGFASPDLLQNMRSRQ